MYLEVLACQLARRCRFFASQCRCYCLGVAGRLFHTAGPLFAKLHGTPSTTDLSGRATLYGRHRCLVGLMPNSHGPTDPTRQSCLCRVRRCELSRPNRPTIAFCVGVRPAVAPAVPATQNALVGRSGRLRSHRPTRQSRLSVSRLVCRCE